MHLRPRKRSNAVKTDTGRIQICTGQEEICGVRIGVGTTVLTTQSTDTCGDPSPRVTPSWPRIIWGNGDSSGAVDGDNIGCPGIVGNGYGERVTAGNRIFGGGEGEGFGTVEGEGDYVGFLRSWRMPAEPSIRPSTGRSRRQGMCRSEVL